MSIQSMTGFGKASKTEAGYSIAVELKSVNNRFLEFSLRAPRAVQNLEGRVRQTLGAFIGRGSISCHIQCESPGQSAGTALILNESLFAAYRDLLHGMQERIGLPSTVNLVDLAKMPELVGGSGEGEDAEALWNRILPVFEEACRDLLAMRIREGETLARDLHRRVSGFSERLGRIRALLPQRQEDYVKRMRQRIQDMLGGEARLSEERLITEIGLMAEKLDVTEELVRFDSHIEVFLDTLARHKSPGKKLGFLLQEMHREINTLGNKSQSAEVQHLAVDIKEELEIIREQLANIE